VIGVANYGLTFVVDAPYLLEEGVDVTDFPVIVKIPIANTTNLYDKGETADTIYFESEGVQLKHELMEITATYCTAWIKMDLEADSKKVVTLHYGALVDNNYEDKWGVWVNGSYIYHFNGNANDTMGNVDGVPVDANVLFGYAYGMNYQGCYIPASKYITAALPAIAMPYTIIVCGGTVNYSGGNSYPTYMLGGDTGNNILIANNPLATPGSTLTFITNSNSATISLAPIPIKPQKVICISKAITGNNLIVYVDSILSGVTYTNTIGDSTKTIARLADAFQGTSVTLSEILIFTGAKSAYWQLAFTRMYRNPDAYIEYGTEVDLDALTALDIDEADCVANVSKQLGIYDVDFRNIMYEIGDYNATWRLPGTEGITIWGIYQPRPVGDYYFPEMDNLGINDALFFTVTDYLVDIHDKIDIEGVRFDLQAIQVHPIADQKIYKMCVLKRQPEYYATAKGVVS
jgi:hypothetical protein